MEVHHHPDLHHQKKPWKEYLLEGFMIFIAVMMGFIAENVREDITNNQHAHELTSLLVADLKADTSRLNKVIDEQTKIRQANDSLFTLLQQPLAKADLNQIQRLIINANAGLDPDRSDAVGSRYSADPPGERRIGKRRYIGEGKSRQSAEIYHLGI
jgi:hypothetical protein